MTISTRPHDMMSPVRLLVGVLLCGYSNTGKCGVPLGTSRNVNGLANILVNPFLFLDMAFRYFCRRKQLKGVSQVLIQALDAAPCSWEVLMPQHSLNALCWHLKSQTHLPFLFFRPYSCLTYESSYRFLIFWAIDIEGSTCAGFPPAMGKRYGRGG